MKGPEVPKAWEVTSQAPATLVRLCYKDVTGCLQWPVTSNSIEFSQLVCLFDFFQSLYGGGTKENFTPAQTMDKSLDWKHLCLNTAKTTNATFLLINTKKEMPATHH